MTDDPRDKPREVNFDGLVGPTHNYAGLAIGNIASQTHRAMVSNPREAALQGLAKMRYLAELGLPQAVLPPHDRPAVDALRALGFGGADDAAVLARAAREAPEVLAACASASSMWTANAATVAPSADAADGRVHLTPANLVSTVHRSLEPPTRERILRAVFRDEARFAVHEPVPGGAEFGDEGAANHTRLCADYGEPGLHLFVYGRSAYRHDSPAPRRYPARQSLEASAAVARLHGLAGERVVFARQHPDAIDAGVFHNDVIAVGNQDLFLFHEAAFVDAEGVLAELAEAFRRLGGRELHALRVTARELTPGEAVSSYLFNSQIVTLAPDRMAFVAPLECRESPRVRALIERLIEDRGNPLAEVHYLDVRQSMQNGGGPACLRLRVVLTAAERAAIAPGVLLDEGRYAELVRWVERHYRDRLAQADLGDAALLRESRTALDELTAILGLGSIYAFQR